MKDEVAERLNQGYRKPEKRINDSGDMETFFKSKAYTQIKDLIQRISLAVSQKRIPQQTSNSGVKSVISLLEQLDQFIDDVPPDTGPRRFGNIAFRKWHDKMATVDVEGRIPTDSATTNIADIWSELTPYFLGGFGSKQRLDYGTGHELSFLAFTGGLLYTEIIKDPSGEDLLYLFNAYFRLVQRLILTYTLEPAGSHGVWGLDDHFHLPYILGAAQIVDITEPETPTPDLAPKSMLSKSIVEREAPVNLFFLSIQFINKVKKGPFHEHSPILYGVSDVLTWHKVFKGMVKMYDGEVLSKFPVVQHFLFGSLYSWGSNAQTQARTSV